MIGRLLRRLTRSMDRSTPRETADSESGDDPETGTGDADTGRRSIWDLIPSRQYNGRYAESGGIQRSEQEQALADIQRQADAIEGSEAADTQAEVEDSQ